jgi:hypothetical protein
MNVSTVKFGNGDELRMEQQLIDVTTMSWRPDPNWTFTDSAGHHHARADDGYPTLVDVEEPSYWCADCGDEHTDSHWECPKCGERIVPGTIPPPPGKQFIPGMRSFTLNGKPIDEAEAEKLISAAR